MRHLLILLVLLSIYIARSQTLSLQKAYLSFPATGQPYCITHTDLNHDGIEDIISGNAGGINVSVFYGSRTAPYYQSARPFGDSINTVSCITTGDINQDGWPDIVYGTYNLIQDTVSNKVIILQSSSGGLNFNQTLEFSFTEKPNAISIFDVNEDSLNDIVVAHGHTISIYTASTTAGQFNSPINIILTLSDSASSIKYAAIQQMRAIDMNGDGYKDLVVTDGSSLYVLTLIKSFPYLSLHAQFSIPLHQNETGQDFAVGDINNDGTNDVVVLCRQMYADSVAVFFNDGKGILSFNKKYVLGPPNTDLGENHIVLADLNNDNRLDIATSNMLYTGQKPMISVMLQDPNSFGFLPSTQYVLDATSIDLIIVDANNDGNKDIVTVDPDNADIALVLANKTPGDYSSIEYFNVPFVPFAITSGDINCDGYPDIITTGWGDTTGDNYLSLILSANQSDKFDSPKNLLLSHTMYDPSARKIETADINNDSLLDVVISYLLIPGILTLPGSGTADLFNLGSYWPTSGQANDDFGIFDIDQNDTTDIIVNNSRNFDIEYLKGEGSGIFDLPKTLFSDTLKSKFTICDVNRDGRLDIVALEGDNLVSYVNKGNDIFDKVISKSINKTVVDMIAIDLNGDGNPDIVIAFGDNSQTLVVQLASDSLGHFSPPISLTVPGHQGTHNVGIADMNGDGLLDIVTETFSDICVFTALPGGGFSSPLLFPTGTGEWKLCIDDFNGDLKPDVCICNGFLVKYVKNLTPGTPSGVITKAYINSPSIQTPFYFSTGNINRFGKVILDNYDGSTIAIRTHSAAQPPNVSTQSKVVKRYYEISTNGKISSGQITLPYELSEVSIVGLKPKGLHLFHYMNGVWQLEQSKVNIANQTLTALTIKLDGIWVMCDPNDHPITEVFNGNTNLPYKCSLLQNYPNPFNPSTTFSFSLASKSFVSLKVFDMLGREVAIIISEDMSAGSYTREWNATNISSGVYFYRLQAGLFTETKKLILLR